MTKKDNLRLVSSLLIVFILLFTQITFISSLEVVPRVLEEKPKTQYCPEVRKSYNDERGYYYECIEKEEDIAWYYKAPGTKEFVKSDYQEGVTKIFERYGPLHLRELNTTNISKIIGLSDKKIIGKGIEYDLLGEEGIRLVFKNHVAAVIDIDGNVFKDIIPQEISEHPTFITINTKGEITKADFTVNDPGGNYTFEDKTIYYIPGGSRVFFDNKTGIEIKFPDDADLSKFTDLLKYIQEGYLNKIEGKNIKLPNDINLNGELRISDKGYFLEKGIIDYKKIRLYENILIANPNVDLSDYKGNWIRQTSEILEMQSFEKGSINLEFLEEHEILNTDAKDKLEINVKNGDGLRIEKRENKGLIPKVTHKSSDKGESYIRNNKIEVIMRKSGVYIKPQEPLYEDDLSKKYQSVTFEIESDSKKIDKKLRINSYSQFAVLSEKDKKIVTYNEYDLPISALIKDNGLQTIEQMREKYPGLEFEVLEEIYLNEDNLPPYLLYLTDYFLKENPKAVKDFERIQYSNVYNAGVSSEEPFMMIGRKAVDPTSSASKEMPTREIKYPLQTFIHEYEHRRDQIIEDKEIEALKILNERNLIDPELDTLLKTREEILQRKMNENDKLKILEFESYLRFNNKIIRLTAYENDYETLQQKYNKLVINSISYNKKFKKSLGKIINDIKKDIESKKISILSLPGIKESIKELEDEMGPFEQEQTTEMMEEIISFYSWIDVRDPQLQLYKNKIDNLIRTHTGLTYTYALRNYDDIEDNVILGKYLELSSTYREQPIETRKMLVNSGNKMVSEMYKKLTQLAFDSGKMDVKEYKTIMGEKYCKKDDCLDKLCVEYKILCCVEHRNSPNC